MNKPTVWPTLEEAKTADNVTLAMWMAELPSPTEGAILHETICDRQEIINAIAIRFFALSEADRQAARTERFKRSLGRLSPDNYCPRCQAASKVSIQSNGRRTEVCFECDTTLIVDLDAETNSLQQSDRCRFIVELKTDRDKFRTAYVKYTTTVGRIFFDNDRRPVLPDFCKPGDDIVESLFRLARRYLILESRGALSEADRRCADDLAKVDIEFCRTVAIPEFAKAIGDA